MSASSPLPPTGFARLAAEPRFHLALVMLLAAVLFFSKLGGNGLPNYDDCYYAQKGKEIGQTGDWLTLHFNGKPRFDNPPLFMWLVALSYKLFGVSEFAARFPSALLGLATVVLVYLFARRLFTAWAGFFSAVVLTTTLLFARYARRAMVDVTLTFFVCLAFFALWLALHKDRRYFLLWGTAIALAILTKSVLGGLPLLITVLYLLTTRRGRWLLDGWFLLGLAAALLLGGSWYLHQYLAFGPRFLEVHFGWLVFARGFAAEPQPWHAPLYYLKELATHHWPWLPLLAFAVARWARRAGRKEENTYLLALWLLTTLVLLSIPQARVVWYMLPVFPAAAMLCGAALRELLSDRAKLLAAQGCLVLALVALVAVVAIHATPLQLSPPRETDVRALAPTVRHFGDRGARITAFRQVPHALNNALLFYSDHAASTIFETPSELATAFREPAPVLCVVRRADLAIVTKDAPGIYILRETEKFVLVANQPLEAGAVKTP